MYISRLILDNTYRKVMEGFVRPVLFHGAIEQSVGEQRMRNIWRLDKFKGKYCLIVVTPVKPDLRLLQEQFGLEGYEPLSVCYDSFIDRIHENQQWRFRVKINPVVCRNGKRCEVNTRDIIDWFILRANDNGFKVDKNSADIIEITKYDFNKTSETRYKHGSYVQFKAVTIDGILTIADADKMKNALINGIGKEKAYGCGLITLAAI